MYDAVEDFLSFFIKGMQSAMLWPSNTRNRFILALLNSARIVVSIVLCYTTAGLLAQAILYPNLKEIGLTVEIATMTSSACYKMIFIVLNKNRFLRIVRYMTDYFKMEYYSEDGVIKMNISDSRWKCKLLSTLYSIYGILCMVVWSLIPIFERRVYDKTRNANNSTTYEQYFVLPLSCWFPFNERQSPMYEITYFLQFFSLLASIYIYLMNDCFFFTTIYLTSVQLKILREMLNNFNRRLLENDRSIDITTSNKTDIGNPNRKLRDGISESSILNLNCISRTVGDERDKFECDRCYRYELKECVIYHSKLLSFIHELEKLNSTLILADILHALISITFLMFTLMTSESLIDWIKMGPFFIISILHQLLNAEFGELLAEEQKKILNVIYNVQWFEAKIEERKLLIAMMTNSQNIILLSGVKMYILCRVTFIKFIKSLFSYYVVLRQRADR